MAELFPGFERARIAVPGAELNVLRGGEGPALLLLHGYPQTHVAWHAVAPRLAQHFELVVPDLRGYGESRGPDPRAGDEGYAKRSMAKDAIALMSHFGHERFAVAGHDRGGRVAYRLALDHPERVTRLAALDIVPTGQAFDEMNWARASAAYHWLFLAQPGGMPEHLIGLDPDYYLEHLLSRWAVHRDRLDASAVAAYRDAFARAEVIAATCADYRAGLGIDAELDRIDAAAGRRIECPVAIIWARGYLASKTAGPLAAWQRFAADVREYPIDDCGHFVMEEQSAECASTLLDFLQA